MNKFLEDLKEETNYTYTENGALAHKTTNKAVYDMFALGAAYRKRSNTDCILLFKNALEEDESLALKCLFYLRDIRGGQGERRFFRVCFEWLCIEHPDIAERNLIFISEYGRWDDLLYATQFTQLKNKAFYILKTQLAEDLECKTPSLLGKWLPSENASSRKTKKAATAFREYLDMTHKQYRKILSALREKINIVARLMSENRWDEIEFDKIPSKAGLVYRNAFARRDILAKKYEIFMKDKNTKVNAASLYPYEIVEKVANCYGWYSFNKSPELNFDDPERLALNKYWENLPDYLEGQPCSMICVVDTSSSMYGRAEAVATSLGLYCAERIGEPFKNHFISFSRKANLIKTEGIDFVDKIQRIYRQCLCENTNIDSVFDLLKNIALHDPAARESMPKTIVIISDMEIDGGSEDWTEKNTATHMERIKKEWETLGLKVPHLIYWNVESRNENKFLDSGEDVTFVGGCSPVIFKSVLTGKTGYELCLEVLNSDRYKCIG